MTAVIMARVNKAEDKAHGETKKPKQFLITETASNMLDEVSGQAGLSRSEFIERLIRCTDAQIIEKVKNFGVGDNSK